MKLVPDAPPSPCCQAPVVVAGKEGSTRWYACSKCGRPISDKTFRYATDEEFDAALKKVHQHHSKLLQALADHEAGDSYVEYEPQEPPTDL